MTTRDPDQLLRALASAVTGRDQSFLQDDMADLRPALQELLGGSHVCITGGGGFIARQVLFRLFDYRPARVTLIDVSENSLAATMRDVHTGACDPDDVKVEAVLADLTSPIGRHALTRLGRVNVIVHLAAVKHVRSERDEISVARMFAVNVGTAVAVTETLADRSPEVRIMAVSTDKAAQPQTLMGASKRLMEILLLQGHDVSVARFPNVAFSTGSLLDSWRRRLVLGEPLPVPRDTRRFLVTPVEAADMCLAGMVAGSGRIVIPRRGALRSEELIDVLHAYLRFERRSGHSVEITDREFASEKADELFSSHDERASPWLRNLAVVESTKDAARAQVFWSELRDRLSDPRPPLLGPDFHQRLGAALPEYTAPLIDSWDEG